MDLMDKQAHIKETGIANFKFVNGKVGSFVVCQSNQKEKPSCSSP